MYKSALYIVHVLGVVYIEHVKGTVDILMFREDCTCTRYSVHNVFAQGYSFHGHVQVYIVDSTFVFTSVQFTCINIVYRMNIRGLLCMYKVQLALNMYKSTVHFVNCTVYLGIFTMHTRVANFYCRVASLV